MKDAFGVEVSKAMFPGAAARVVPKALKAIKPNPLVASKVASSVRPPRPGMKPMTPAGPKTPSGTPMTNNTSFASRINPR